jgi:cell division septal protein FtsQ
MADPYKKTSDPKNEPPVEESPTEARQSEPRRMNRRALKYGLILVIAVFVLILGYFWFFWTPHTPPPQ